MQETQCIRAELLAPQYIQQLPSIEKLLLHLEGKGRSKKLIEADFTYVTTAPDGTMLFNKAK